MIKKFGMQCCALLLAGCGISYTTVHKSENASEFHLNADYQVAYRIISEGMRGCETPEVISSVIYTDQKTANVTFSAHQVTAWTLDLADDNAGGTNATFFTVFNAQKQRIKVFEAWVHDGMHGCWPDRLTKP